MSADVLPGPVTLEPGSRPPGDESAGPGAIAAPGDTGARAVGWGGPFLPSHPTNPNGGGAT